MNIAKAWAAQLDDYAIDLAWSPDGRVLAVASAAGPVTLFDAPGTLWRTLPGHADGTNAIAFAPVVIPESGDRKPDRSILASCGQDGSARFWDGVSGTQTAKQRPSSPCARPSTYRLR